MAPLDDEHTATLRRPLQRLRHRGRIVVVAGPDSGRQLEFEGRVRIGSRGLADLVLADSKVSGLHCEVIAGAEDLRVRDLSSKNGTFVGRVRVVEAVLAPWDVIELGDSRVQVAPLDDVVEAPTSAEHNYHGVVGRSPAMQAVIARLQQIAPTDSTVLLLGETGTGKELVAEALHAGSRRAPGPLVTVDCGAIPATLIDSELFGHERGAFTGAQASFAGAFERARGGTIFLDEIGELPLSLQPKLLRVLESREVRRLGSSRTLPVDVRVVAATNRDLPMEVNAGRFREDLYYRLAVVTLTLPPLRERIEDLPLLIVSLLGSIGVDPSPFLGVEALGAFAEHPWPGNVRELRNTLERAANLSEPPRMDAQAPPPPAPSAPEDLSVPLGVGRQRLLAAYERRYIAAMLAACNGNITEVARRSGIGRMSVYRLLHKLGLREGDVE
jgi:DNA-binding NtrC family response regulator